MKVVARFLQVCKRKRFVVKSRETGDCKIISPLVLYCSSMSEGKNMLAVQRGPVVKEPSARCMVPGEDSMSGQMASGGSLKDTTIAEK